MAFIKYQILTKADKKRLQGIVTKLLQTGGQITPAGWSYAHEPCPTTPRVKDATTTFFNPGIEKSLMAVGKEYPIILGGMYLLTSKTFLKFLQSRECIFILQNHDFITTRPGKSPQVLEEYSRLSCTLPPAIFPTLKVTRPHISPISVYGAPLSIRSQTSKPLMHSKYMIFGNLENGFFAPQAVVLGSANMTYNATRSVEHMTMIAVPSVAEVYYTHFCEVFNKSKPGI